MYILKLINRKVFSQNQDFFLYLLPKIMLFLFENFLDLYHEFLEYLNLSAILQG